MSSEKLHTVFIEKLVPGGLGLGRLEEGIVVFVRHVLPGEKVMVRELHRKKDFVSAVVHEILSPSPERITPPCSYYGRCGGCDLQHTSYSNQILLKKKILLESLQRTAGDIISAAHKCILPPLVSPKEFAYRQRIRLQVDNKGKPGFYQSGSHTLEPVSKCLLAGKGINSVLQRFRTNISLAELAGECSSFELLFNPDSEGIIVLLHFKHKPRPRDFTQVSNLVKTSSGIDSILIRSEGYGLYNPSRGSVSAKPPHLSQMVSIGNLQKDLKLTWEAEGFCQINLEQNHKLIELVMEMLQAGNSARVLDLFCGYGNFSLPAALISGEVIGVDSQNGAIRSARKNMALNEIHNCKFIKNSVDKEVSTLINAGETFDTVILDPPRQGAAAVVSRLTTLKPEQIIYISCNPATLARDLTSLQASGYELSRLVPVDMFPQTHHLESVALLKKTLHD